MSEPTKESLHKEFELERLILFSDAVFAIAITLLIIEIKFPEIPKGTSFQDTLTLFRPTLVQFISFVISFFFVGMYWAKHLKICKYLRTYDNGIIVRNLFFLFFTVTFPFTASGIGHMRPGFMFPLVLYFFNVFMLALSHHLFIYYMLRSRPHLSVTGETAEKNYILAQSKFTIMILLVLILGTLAEFVFFPNNETAILLFTCLFAAFAAVARRRLRKLKPKKQAV